MVPQILETLVQLRFRQGGSAMWSSLNPVLASGEPGFETDTGKEKRGDGVTPWNLLPYVADLTTGIPLTAVSGTMTRDADGNVNASTQYLEDSLLELAGSIVQNNDGTFSWRIVPSSDIAAVVGYDGGSL